jgi:phosphoenolpyruvate-protein phosphotransferase
MKDKPVILIVDDQPQNIELLEAYLVPDGYEIVKAANGEEALAKLSSNQIDLVLLDVIMPGMDGIEVTRRIRQNNRIPIILVTASRETDDRKKGIEAGCDDFVSKPFDKKELLARVRSLLRENFRHFGNRPETVMNSRPNTLRNSELEFHGKPLAKGIARGKAYLLKRVDLQQLRNDKRIVDIVSSESAKLDLAISRSKNQISRIMGSGSYDVEDPSFTIFESMLRLLDDRGLVSTLKKTLESTALHGESVLAEEITLLRNKASGSTDELTIKNLITMQDLYYRILYNMLPSDENRISSLLKIPAGSILVANRLAPVEVAVVPIGNVVGILIEESTQYSHSSILARTLGVPVIIDFPGIGSLLDESTDVMIDAYKGTVFLNPSEATIKECYDEENRYKAEAKSISLSGDKSAIRSADGFAMHLLCNASNLADVVLAYSNGITEIGLFRSEMRYLANTVLPSDEQEAAYYAGIFGVEGVDDVTVRLLDMGGDKLPVYLQITQESDPQLGCRGIRLLLSRPDLMKKQARAILTARGAFRIRLLLPFITTVEDLVRAREILEEVFIEMKIGGDATRIGIMVEVPSVALSLSCFLPKVDFVCLGTNDLIQYLFAVNRDQADLQKYNRFTHPAFLKMLKEVVASCENQGKELTVCGEMASDPVGCCLLAALGATNLSIQPDTVHQVREALSKLNVAALRAILPTLFDLESADEVEQKIRSLGI